MKDLSFDLILFSVIKYHVSIIRMTALIQMLLKLIAFPINLTSGLHPLLFSSAAEMNDRTNEEKMKSVWQW